MAANMKPQGGKSIQGPLLRGLTARSVTGKNGQAANEGPSLFGQGLDVGKIFWHFGREKCFSLDNCFYRTSRPSGNSRIAVQHFAVDLQRLSEERPDLRVLALIRVDSDQSVHGVQRVGVFGAEHAASDLLRLTAEYLATPSGVSGFGRKLHERTSGAASGTFEYPQVSEIPVIPDGARLADQLHK